MRYVATGAFCAALAVIFGAFGAHGIEARLEPRMLSVYQTAVEYHTYHALGIILIGLIITTRPNSILTRWAAAIMLAGIILFSGSLYLLSFSGMRWLGAITPFGGLAFIIAWLLVGIAWWRESERPPS